MSIRQDDLKIETLFSFLLLFLILILIATFVVHTDYIPKGELAHVLNTS